jgi:hypothetical protein
MALTDHWRSNEGTGVLVCMFCFLDTMFVGLLSCNRICVTWTEMRQARSDLFSLALT